MAKRFINFARAGHRPLGTMNETEAGYALVLEQRLHVGEIVDWKYEKIKLKIGLASRNGKPISKWYHPDFICITKDYQIEFIELKGGYITDEGKGKFLAACAQYPFFKFYMVQVIKGVCKIVMEN